MSQQTIKVNVLTNEVYSSGIHVECIYTIDRFLLGMTLFFDLNHQMVSVERIGIKHANFNTNLKMFKGPDKLINESMYHGILSIMDENINLKGSLKKYIDSTVPITELTEEIQSMESKHPHHKPFLQRRITLKTYVSVTPDQKTNAYLLHIEFTKAPSLLHDQTFVIPIDHHQVLKQQFSGTLAHEYNLYFANEIISLIFDEFLTKFFWMYPPDCTTSLFGPTLDAYTLDKLPMIYSHDRSLLYSCYDRGLELDRFESFGPLFDDNLETFRFYMEHAYVGDTLTPNAIEKVEYIVKSDPTHAVECIMNGIGIRIDIKDPSINPNTYPSLFDMFKFYQIEPPNLSTIWSFTNPSQLYDLSHLYEAIRNLNNAIEIHAQLLIDKNVDNDDILLILVHWSKHINLAENVAYQILSNYHGALNIPISGDFAPVLPCDGVDRKWHKQAQELCHTDFNESVKMYGVLMRASPQPKRRQIINNDKHHFGEPLIVLREMKGSKYEFGCFVTDDLLSMRYIDYGIQGIMMRNEINTGVKKGRRRHNWMQKDIACNLKQQKKMSKNKLYRAKKYSYHRW
eukprot:347928_1